MGGHAGGIWACCGGHTGVVQVRWRVFSQLCFLVPRARSKRALVAQLRAMRSARSADSFQLGCRAYCAPRSLHDVPRALAARVHPHPIKLKGTDPSPAAPTPPPTSIRLYLRLQPVHCIKSPLETTVGCPAPVATHYASPPTHAAPMPAQASRIDSYGSLAPAWGHNSICSPLEGAQLNALV